MRTNRPRVHVDTPQIRYPWLGTGVGTPVISLHQPASSSAKCEKLMPQLAGERPQWTLETLGANREWWCDR